MMFVTKYYLKGFHINTPLVTKIMLHYLPDSASGLQDT